MTVSVVIPAYNCSKYLENVVRSVHNSGLSAYEVLIINDGSTDSTENVARHLQDCYCNVRVISQENGGVSKARNRGILEAAGDYVFFVDADDSLVPESLSDVNGILDAEQPDMLLFGMVFDYYKRGVLYRSDAMRYPVHGIISSARWAQEYAELYDCNMLSPVWNKLIRRNLILNNQVLFREDMIEMEDYLFSAQCLLFCERIYLLDKAAYRYRQAEDEKGTYNRLWKIQSLSEYMHPFFETSKQINARFSTTGIPFNAICVAEQIYSTLFHEKLRFAAPKQIAFAAQDMLSGEHSDVIARMDPGLFQKLQDGQYARVWVERALRRARHRIAVLVKYNRSMRNRKDEARRNIQ